jgi:hypothetical protein
MQFDRDEFALLSRGGRVPRTSRAGPRSGCDAARDRDRDRERRPSRLAAAAGRWAGSVRTLRAGVQATWTAFGESQDR